MNKLAKVTIITVISGLASLTAVNANAAWGAPGQGGYCNQSGMVNGMPMRMKQKGQKGHRGRFMQQDLDLSLDEAKILAQAHLIRRGNDRLKVGSVTEKSDKTYLVKIVTVDNSLVREMEIDRNTGRPVGAGPGARADAKQQ